jgi:hypothetical protein
MALIAEVGLGKGRDPIVFLVARHGKGRCVANIAEEVEQERLAMWPAWIHALLTDLH